MPNSENSEKLKRMIIAKIKEQLDIFNTWVVAGEKRAGVGMTGEKRVSYPDFDNLSDKQLLQEFEKALFINVDTF